MRRYFTWSLIALLWALFIGFAYFTSQYGNFGISDFRVYYETASRFLFGQNPYNGISGMVYLYPPLLSQLLMPLAATFSLHTAWIIWFAVNNLLIFGVLVLLGRHTPPGQLRRLWIFPLLFWALFEALYIGQVSILMLALIAAAWVALKEDKPELAGALLALAAWVKVYPALIIVYLIYKRNWRFTRGVVVAGIALLLLQIAVSGVDTFLSSFQVLFALSEEGQLAGTSSNASIVGFTSQLFEAHPMVQPLLLSPPLQTISRVALTLLVVGALFALAAPSARRHSALEALRFDLEYGLAVLSSLLLSPTLYSAGMPPLLITIFLIWRGRYTDKWVTWACALIGITLSLYWMYAVGYTGDPPASALQLGFGFYALMALWGVNVVLLRRRATAAALSTALSEA
jgi:hypothetical protein